MNDIRIDRNTRDRNFRRVRGSDRARTAALLAGAVAAMLVAASPVTGQSPVSSRVTVVPDGMQVPGYEMAPQQPTVHPSMDSLPTAWDVGLGPECEFGCPPTWRVRAEAIWMNREGDGRVSVSNGFGLDEFDYTEGGRVALARKYDCSLGWELVYTGLFDWEEAGTVTAPGTLSTSLIPSGINMSAFNNADVHQQLYRSQLQSSAIVQKWWGWDVLTTMSGFRYILVEEDFDFRSVDGGGNVGLFSIETNNQLLGAELGVELFVPIGRWSFDSMFKGGLFANVGDSQTVVSNAGTLQLSNEADDLEFAALLEWGVYLRYMITPRINIRAGYELLWIYGLGIAVDQVHNPITFNTGERFEGNGDTFYHGAIAGVEVIW